MMHVHARTARGVLLDGDLFSEELSDTLLIAITGIHGNFYSNPFYFNIGRTLSSHGYDFLYAQTNDAFGQIRPINTKTGRQELIGSWNERFAWADEDIQAWLDYARKKGYRRIVLAGHSLGANKVISYLSTHPDAPIEHFILLSPANLDYLLSPVSPFEKQLTRDWMKTGREDGILPFDLLGWIHCTAATASDWVFSDRLNNVHTDPDGDFSQAEAIQQTGAMLIGTYDSFTDGDPVRFLQQLNAHMPSADQNRLIFIEKTGHTYQQKEQELADLLLELMETWCPLPGKNQAESSAPDSVSF